MYKEKMFRIDKKVKGKDKKMLETFGKLLEEKGWTEIK